jgi:N-acetylglucosaminylphosphatidylinositol deacetylase
MRQHVLIGSNAWGCIGEVENLRETRKSELLKSASVLGLRSPEDVSVVEDACFPDSMSVRWEADDVASALSREFVASASGTKKMDSAVPAASSTAINIDVLVTFDARGISSHTNHISLHYGALHWLRQTDPTGGAVAMYSLTTTNIARKYASLFDSPFSILYAALQKSTTRLHDRYPDHLLFLGGVSAYRRAQMAMTRGHVSQMLWFRWGWIGLSRYVIVNDLRREYPASP